MLFSRFRLQPFRKTLTSSTFFFFWTLTAVHVNGVRHVGNPAGYKIRPCFLEFLRHERMEAPGSALLGG